MGKRDGYTLVEVVISILLTAVLVSSLFSMMLSVKSSSGKADRKVLGAQAVQALTDALKTYVTADTSTTMIKGPNYMARCGGGACAAAWNIHTPGIQTDNQCSINAATGQPTIASANWDVYALTAGTHCLNCVATPTGGADSTCFLPSYLRNAPYNGMVYYTVSGNPPQASVGVWWNEP